ncbi:MAG: radical SAM protein [Candidatus Thiodiazotropha endolucinida]
MEYVILQQTMTTVLCLSSSHSVVFETSLDEWKEYKSKGEVSQLGLDLDRLGLLASPDTSPEPSTAMDFTNLILNLTNACNLNCSYCFLDGVSPKTMSDEVFRKAVSLAQRSFSEERVNLAFFGGEPLLMFDRIKGMVKYAKQELEDRRLTFTITTNGTLVTTEIAEFFAEYDFNVIVSLDSVQEVNSKTRQPKCGSTSEMYSTIMGGMRRMLDAGVHLACNIVLCNENISSLSDFVEQLRAIGIGKITMAFVSDRQHILTSESFDALLEQTENFVDLLLGDENLTIDPYSAVMKLVREHKMHLYRCGYGRLRINVQPDGVLTPCQRMQNTMGSVDEGVNLEFSRLAAYDTVDNKPVCKDCGVRYLCGGNCYHESLIYEGDLKQAHRPYCDYYVRVVSQVASRMMEQCPPIVDNGRIRVL